MIEARDALPGSFDEEAVLNYVAPLLGDTALLYFDDWADFGPGAQCGEPKAFAEFMQQNGDRFAAEPFADLLALGGKGKAFIIRRKSP